MIVQLRFLHTHGGRCLNRFNVSKPTTLLASIWPSSQIVTDRRMISSAGQQQTSSSTGRKKRFYKVVDVKPISAPWEKETGKNGGTKPIDSPISAGIDGTSSGVNNVSLNLPSESEKRQMLSTIKKSSDEEEEFYTVTLDGRPLRTPLGQPLSLPSKILALAVAMEWDMQKDFIIPTQMPLMTLSCTSIDQTAQNPQLVIDVCKSYFQHDTLCYFTDPENEYDRLLYRKQTKLWNHLHEWIQKKFQQGKPATVIGSQDAIVVSKKHQRNSSDDDFAPGLPHPPMLSQAIDSYMENLNAWELTALQSLTREAKSLILALSVLEYSSSSSENESNNNTVGFSKELNMKDIILASRIEEEFQIENWGLVEGGHDYDRLNCSIGMYAATFLIRSIQR